MKKIPRKLVIRIETVRMLDNIALVRARGGGDSVEAAGTNRTQSGIVCPAQANMPMPR